MKLPLLSEVRLGKDRVMAFLRAWHFVHRAKIPGDYLEFGVMDGMSFKLSLYAAAKFIARDRPRAPRFFAFDSFAGLPAPSGERDGNVWGAGECSATRRNFERNIRSAAKGWQVRIVEGFYEQTLTDALRVEHCLEQAAFVTIDCDLYESTLAALRFVTPLLRTGTVIYFDDWYFSNGNMALGEPGACGAWLAEHPELSLVDYGDVGIMGKCFIVQRAT